MITDKTVLQKYCDLLCIEMDSHSAYSVMNILAMFLNDSSPSSLTDKSYLP